MRLPKITERPPDLETLLQRAQDRRRGRPMTRWERFRESLGRALDRLEWALHGLVSLFLVAAVVVGLLGLVALAIRLLAVAIGSSG